MTQTATSAAGGRVYYIDSRAATNGDGSSSSSPLRSLSSITLAAGDTVLFACGSSYSETIILSSANLTIGSYGSGAKPFFSNSANRTVCMLSGTGIRVDGLHFGVSTYSGIELTGSGNTIVNCEISGLPKGIAISGADNIIDHNTFRDGILQPGRNGSNDDVGALGICLNSGANNTEIANNSFIRCKAPSPDYGIDGGAIEIYGNVNGVRIHHNHVEDCSGVIEFGGGTIQNVEIYRNILRNNGGIGGLHTSGAYAASIAKISYTHNTIYDVVGGSELLWVYGTAGQSELSFRNNIVYYDGFQRFSSAAGIVHQSNILYSPSANPLGIPADSTDLHGIQPGFISSTDLHLKPDSVAINKGQATPYSLDFDGLPLVGTADIGAYESQVISRPDTTAPTPPTNLVASAISPNAFQLTWTASTDNIAVSGYEVFRNGISILSTPSPSALVSGLTASTGYSITVIARDAAGNTSPPSPALSVTTAAPPNLLLNPGYENGVASWSGSGAKLTTTPIRYSGNAGLLVSGRTSASSGPQQSITAVLNAGGSGTYNAEAFVRMASGSALARITVKYTIDGQTFFASTPSVAVGKSGFTRISGALLLNLNGPVQNASYTIETSSGKMDFYTDQTLLTKPGPAQPLAAGLAGAVLSLPANRSNPSLNPARTNIDPLGMPLSPSLAGEIPAEPQDSWHAHTGLSRADGLIHHAPFQCAQLLPPSRLHRAWKALEPDSCLPCATPLASTMPGLTPASPGGEWHASLQPPWPDSGKAGALDPLNPG